MHWLTWRVLGLALLLSGATTLVAVYVNLATSDASSWGDWVVVGLGTLASALLATWFGQYSDPAVRKIRQAEHQAKRRERANKREKEALELVFRDPGWLTTLSRLYDDPSSIGPRFPLLTLNNERFPIWTFQATPSDDLDTPLTKPLDRTRVAGEDSYASWYHDSEELKREYASLLRSVSTRNKFNGPCYAFRRLRVISGEYKIEAAPGWYFDSLVTSEALDEELITALRNGVSQPITLDRLPRRGWIHSSTTESPVLDGRTRGAALSVSGTLIVAEPDGEFSLWLTRRSLDVATHPGFYNLAPAGIFAPLETALGSRTFEVDYSVRQSLLREYAEELFDYKNMERGRLEDGRLLTAQNLETGNPRVESLLRAVDASRVQLRYVGISVNLLTLRPEIHVLILVRDAGWWRGELGRAERDGHPLTVNWEARSDRVEQIPLGQELELPKNSEIFHPAMMVPNSAAGVALALPAARQAVLGVPLAPL